MSSDKKIALDTKLVAICGNPNSGKTTIFNHITGLNQQVGNYSGVTVEKVTGHFYLDSLKTEKFTLVDIPGTYSLSAFSPDEYIAASSLYAGIDGNRLPDAIVCVIDATMLERSIYLLLQVMQIGRPIVVALNMIDLAKRRGIKIDYETLSERLGGIPVIPVIGNKGLGIAELKEAMAQASKEKPKQVQSHYDPEVEQILDQLQEPTIEKYTRAELLRVLFDPESPVELNFLRENNSASAQLLSSGRDSLRKKYGSLAMAETISLTTHAARMTQIAIADRKDAVKSFSEAMDKVLLHSISGPIILVAIMTFMFQSIFTWAEPFMAFIDSGISLTAGLVESSMADGPLRSLLTDGIIGGVGAVLVFIPQIAILFLFIALLEDSGYMSRAAFLVDRMFRWCGLSGKSFIPLLSSFACAVPGVMATRTIEDRKLRLMTIVVAPLMSCSARLPVYAIMIAAFIPYQSIGGVFNLQGLILTSLYAMGVVAAIIVSFILKKTLLKTEKGTFLLEMPSYKLPTLKSVIIRVSRRVRSFVIRAGTVIMAITIIIWALSYFPRSTEIESTYQQKIVTSTQSHDESLSTMDESITALVATSPRELAGLRDEWTVLYDNLETETILQASRVPLVGAEQSALSLERLLLDRRSAVILHESSLSNLANEKAGENLRASYLGRMGHMVEPLFIPLGWDWRISMAVLASFPAREVVVATIGTIFNLGTDTDEESTTLIDRMRMATWESGDKVGSPLFTPAVALSVMVFFALCCQCGATLVTIKQETGSYLYPIGVFVYMTVLAYVGSFVTYQLIVRIWS